jgi:hypothetical protein
MEIHSGSSKPQDGVETSLHDAIRLASNYYGMSLGRELDDGARRAIEARVAGGANVGFQFAVELMGSTEFRSKPVMWISVEEAIVTIAAFAIE